MARAIDTIQQAIIATLVSSAAAVGITIVPAQWSAFDYRQLLTFITAVAIATLEQLWDAYSADQEARIATVAPQTIQWIQYMCLNVFQYNATVPQILELRIADGSFVPDYPSFVAAYRIVTQCAIVPGVFGTTTVRVAKGGDTPVALTTGVGGELPALQSFLNLISVPGIIINATSDNADKLYLNGVVTYNGQYSAVIQTSVVSATQNYLRSIPTTGIVAPNSPVGVMKLTDLIAAVKAVPGVIDFELNNVNARPDGTAFVPGSNNMVLANDWIMPAWQSGQSGAGYIVGETTTGFDLNNSIIYIAQ